MRHPPRKHVGVTWKKICMIANGLLGLEVHYPGDRYVAFIETSDNSFLCRMYVSTRTIVHSVLYSYEYPRCMHA